MRTCSVFSDRLRYPSNGVYDSRAVSSQSRSHMHMARGGKYW